MIKNWRKKYCHLSQHSNDMEQLCNQKYAKKHFSISKPIFATVFAIHSGSIRLAIQKHCKITCSSSMPPRPNSPIKIQENMKNTIKIGNGVSKQDVLIDKMLPFVVAPQQYKVIIFEWPRHRRQTPLFKKLRDRSQKSTEAVCGTYVCFSKSSLGLLYVCVCITFYYRCQSA